MTTPLITVTGFRRNDYYLINGSPNLAIIPKGKIKGFNDDEDMPIRLPYGTSAFGAYHIKTNEKRYQWLLSVEPSGCIATFLWKKLQQNGDIYVEVADKINITLRIQPSISIILKKQQGFFSVTTVYSLQNKTPHGRFIRKYLGQRWGNKNL